VEDLSHLNLVTNHNFFFRVSNITGTIVLDKKTDDDETIVMPGESLTIEVVLVEKAVINKGLRFVMREGKKTIGAGAILEIIE